MRILYFSTRDCWPPRSGGRLRDFHLTRELSRRAEVTYLGFKRSPESDIYRGPLCAESHVKAIIVPRGPGYGVTALARGLTGPLPATIVNFVSARMKWELEQILDQDDFDVVQIEGVHLFPYIDAIRAARRRPKLICDWHNIESELMRRHSERAARSMAQRWYAKRTAGLIHRLEDRLLRECDGHLVCSDREQSVLQNRAPGAVIQVISNGTDIFQSLATAQEEPAALQDIIFVGSMDYHANIDAVLHFVRCVWPQIHRARPHLRFVIVGSCPAREVLQLSSQPGVVVTGTVNDVRPYYKDASVAVVPLRVGSGTRLKVLEAMAAGVPVISTRLGAEGLDLKHEEHLMLAETPQEFLDAIFSLQSDSKRRTTLINAASEIARSRYDWRDIGESLYGFYLDRLSTSPGNPENFVNPIRSIDHEQPASHSGHH